MRLIYTKDGFTKNEKEEWRVIIFNNILDGLRTAADAMEEYNFAFELESTTVRFQLNLQFPRGQMLTTHLAGSPPHHNAREGP